MKRIIEGIILVLIAGAMVKISYPYIGKGITMFLNGMPAWKWVQGFGMLMTMMAGFPLGYGLFMIKTWKEKEAE